MKITKTVAGNVQQLPIDIVGSTTFGRYTKISASETFNMIISDDWLVPFAGYKKANSISFDGNGNGRGLFSSTRSSIMLAVIDEGVYRIDQNLIVSKVGNLETTDGDVFMDQNNASQICICDKKNLYIYQPLTGDFHKVTTLDPSVLPGYVAFQNTYFIIPDLNTEFWYLSGNNDGDIWPQDAFTTGEIQTKPDTTVAAVRVPGKGNLLFVFGKTVTEAWYDIGSQLFPYQRNTFFNCDYGCLNAATIATTDRFVIWLGSNEKSGPVIMFSDGGEPQQISTDGINFKLANLTDPTNAVGFAYKQDGHLFYQLTFPDDKLTYIYDFNTQKFFTITDEYMSYHIAKKVVFFNNSYYFISFNDGNLYELSSEITTYASQVNPDLPTEIPRIRVCSSLRMPDASRFVLNNIQLTLEQGTSHESERIDLTVSVNGGISYGNGYGVPLNNYGQRPNRCTFWAGLAANDLIPQFRFWGQSRYVIGGAVASIYQ